MSYTFFLVDRALTSVNILGNAISVDQRFHKHPRQAQKFIEILDASCTLTTLCGFTGEETELVLSKRGLSAPCAVLVATEDKANSALTSITINDYDLLVEDIKTKAELDFSDKKLDITSAMIIAALLPLNEYVVKCIIHDVKDLFNTGD